MRWLPLLALSACTIQSGDVGGGFTNVMHTLPHPPELLDILFVIDDSPSMKDDQRALVEAARTELFDQLRDEGHEMPDLHLAVVSTSVTSHGADDICDASPHYDPAPDGKFLLGPWTGFPATVCPGITGTFLADAPDGHGGRITNFTGKLDDQFACAAMLGDEGCGFEKPLEAIRRALDGEHAENAGFLRDDAMLLVVILSDEDDSSMVDDEKWAYDSRSKDPITPNDREFEYGVVCEPDDNSHKGLKKNCHPRSNPSVIHDIGEYVTFLRSLKTDPALVAVAGIVSPPGPVELIDATDGYPLLGLAGTCTLPPGPCADDPTKLCDRDAPEPAVRLNAFMADFPSRYVLQSMCDDTMDEHVSRIAKTTSGVMTNKPCLLGLTTAPTAEQCVAFDVAPDGTRTRVPFTLSEDDATCDYTPTHVRADVDPVDAEHHIEISCI